MSYDPSRVGVSIVGRPGGERVEGFGEVWTGNQRNCVGPGREIPPQPAFLGTRLLHTVSNSVCSLDPMNEACAKQLLLNTN